MLPCPCRCAQVSQLCCFADTPHHLGRPTKKKARSGCVPILPAGCRILATSLPWSLRLPCHLQPQENTTSPTWVKYSKSSILFPFLSQPALVGILVCFHKKRERREEPQHGAYCTQNHFQILYHLFS